MWLGSHIAVALARLAATARIGPLAWEPTYATGVALKRQKDKKTDCWSIVALQCLCFRGTEK